jgi:hypothetical protein
LHLPKERKKLLTIIEQKKPTSGGVALGKQKIRENRTLARTAVPAGEVNSGEVAEEVLPAIVSPQNQ